MSTTPIDRLRELHRPCSVPCFTHSLLGDRAHCWQWGEPWPCDTIAALDALEAEAKDAELTVLKVAADLWARIDAAEVLIRQAMEGWHSLHSAYLPDIDTCPHCAPYREWLAGDKEAE